MEGIDVNRQVWKVVLEKLISKVKLTAKIQYAKVTSYMDLVRLQSAAGL